MAKNQKASVGRLALEVAAGSTIAIVSPVILFYGLYAIASLLSGKKQGI